MIQFLSELRSLLRGSRREVILLAVAAAVLLVLTGYSFWLSKKALKDGEVAEELNRFNMQLTEFIQKLRTAESGQRGYLLTGNEDFLQPYNAIRDQLLPLAQNLEAAAPAQLKKSPKMVELLPQLQQKLAEMEATISFLRRGEREKAIDRVKEGAGVRLSRSIEGDIREIQAEGNQIVRGNEEKIVYLQSLQAIIDATGAIIILTFTSFSLFFLLKSNAGILDAKEALAKANAELEETVEQRTAALKRANEEIQRFAYIVSHDLRSPLVNIMGFTSELEILRKELFEKLEQAHALEGTAALAKDFDEAFGFIKTSIARMDRLINAILWISREGKRPLNPEEIDVKAVINAILSGLTHQIRDKGAEIEIGALPNLVSDRMAIEQIFANIVENAVKFLKPNRPGKIKIEGEERGAQIVYSVSDNGRGIDPKDHQRVFELFRRAGARDIPGEGMGLAYVLATVRRLGGGVDLRSAPGEGSTFIVTLPADIRAWDKRKAA